MFGRFLSLVVALTFAFARAQAITATWNLNPSNGDWNTALNWSSTTVPNGAADIAGFGVSNLTNISISANTEVDRIAFDAGASGYTITAAAATTLTLSGTGIANSSGITQNFVAAVDGSRRFGTIAFRQNASAGSGTSFTASGTIVQSLGANDRGGAIFFYDNAKAGSGVFNINGGPVEGANGGSLAFYNNTSAGSAVITTHGSGVLDSTAGQITFYDMASAGNANFVNEGTTQDATPTFDPWGQASPHFVQGGQMTFRNDSTASQAIFTNNGGTAAYANGGRIRFRETSNAGSAFLTNNGGAGRYASGAYSTFTDSSSAGSATITANGAATVDAYAGVTSFGSNSTAGDSTLIANGGPTGGQGGQILFNQNSRGGTARVQVFGNGNLELSPHNAPGLTIGSLAGTGIVFLGGNTLTVGSNNQSTVFSGVVQDGGSFDGTGGRLTKIGAGRLVLSGTNTYTGATTIEAGELILNGSIPGAVSVNGGTFGGSGVAGSITVNSGGTLSPGNSYGILTVPGNLRHTLGSTYLVDLDGIAVGMQYDQTEVSGAVDLGHAILSLRVSFTPGAGDQFTIIQKGGTDAITGIFNGLSEGATLSTGGETFTISYHGGDGNDVVLTAVVPEPAVWLFLSMGALPIARSLRALAATSTARSTAVTVRNFRPAKSDASREGGKEREG